MPGTDNINLVDFKTLENIDILRWQTFYSSNVDV